jgi:hypothetical protein
MRKTYGVWSYRDRRFRRLLRVGDFYKADKCDDPREVLLGLNGPLLSFSKRKLVGVGLRWCMLFTVMVVIVISRGHPSPLGCKAPTESGSGPKSRKYFLFPWRK